MKPGESDWEAEELEQGLAAFERLGLGSWDLGGSGGSMGMEQGARLLGWGNLEDLGRNTGRTKHQGLKG